MGHTIQYESLTNELSAIYLMEYYEDDVWELCGQFRYVPSGNDPQITTSFWLA
jgi:hypothetical protein